VYCYVLMENHFHLVLEGLGVSSLGRRGADW
jgi:hypothetical protein